jgi:hypothetical protein
MITGQIRYRSFSRPRTRLVSGSADTAEDAAAFLHSRLDPFLELVLRAARRRLLGNLRRDDDHAFLVADHHVTG